MTIPSAEDFLAAFIPIFVAVDAPGVLPAYLGLTDGLDDAQRRSIASRSIVVAGAIGLLFLFGGKAIFRFLGVSVPDFKIAGGLILLLIALSDLLRPDQKRRKVTHDIAIVPVGFPLIVGPGALTALIVLTDARGLVATTSAFMVNLGIAWALLVLAPRVIAIVGPGAAKAISKIMSLLLAAIAVMMMRTGIFELIREVPR